MKKIPSGICIFFAGFCVIWASFFGLKILYRQAQTRFAETHELLSGQDEEDVSDNMPVDDATFKKLDNTINPLRTMDGAVSWKLLAKAKLAPIPKDPNHAVQALFTPDIEKLDHQDVMAQGFMFPLDANEKQSHFVISPYPVSCPYCMPAGPNELIEVFSDKPVKFSYEPIAIKGEFKLLSKPDEIRDGMLYQIKDAKIVTK